MVSIGAVIDTLGRTRNFNKALPSIGSNPLVGSIPTSEVARIVRWQHPPTLATRRQPRLLIGLVDLAYQCST